GGGGIKEGSLEREQGNGEGSIDITGAAAVDRCIAVHRQKLIEPVIVAEPHADYDRGSLEPREVGGPRLESFRIRCRRNDGLDLREIARYRLRQACEIAGGGDDAHGPRPCALANEGPAESAEENE